MAGRCQACGQAIPDPIKTDVVISYPTDGPVKRWDLTEDQLHQWQQDFPNLPVLEECRKALAWVNASPERRKTARGMAKFLVGWFSRANDRYTPARRVTFSQAPEPRYSSFDWRDECRQLHGSRCTNITFHQAQLRRES